jgi:hypothetical protein
MSAGGAGLARAKCQRLRRGTTIETGLFEIQAKNLSKFERGHHVSSSSRKVIRALFGSRGLTFFLTALAHPSSKAERVALGHVSP